MDTPKIIKGVVNGRNYTVTSPIVKEDYGLVLQIEGIEWGTLEHGAIERKVYAKPTPEPEEVSEE